MKRWEKQGKATWDCSGSQDFVQHMSSDRDTLVRQNAVLRITKLTENNLFIPRLYIPTCHSTEIYSSLCGELKHSDLPVA